MPPELNNEEHHSLGHYYNNRLNASLMIQIAETRKKNATLDEVTSDVLNSLKTNGCTILSAPVNDGTDVYVIADKGGWLCYLEIPKLIFQEQAIFRLYPLNRYEALLMRCLRRQEMESSGRQSAV